MATTVDNRRMRWVLPLSLGVVVEATTGDSSFVIGEEISELGLEHVGLDREVEAVS